MKDIGAVYTVPWVDAPLESEKYRVTRIDLDHPVTRLQTGEPAQALAELAGCRSRDYWSVRKGAAFLIDGALWRGIYAVLLATRRRIDSSPIKHVVGVSYVESQFFSRTFPPPQFA
jgi:hypothetical protein